MTDNITLAGKITQKKLLIQQQLKNIVEEHNQTDERRKALYNQALELQGALKAIQELDIVPDDQHTEGEST